MGNIRSSENCKHQCLNCGHIFMRDHYGEGPLNCPSCGDNMDKQKIGCPHCKGTGEKPSRHVNKNAKYKKLNSYSWEIVYKN